MFFGAFVLFERLLVCVCVKQKSQKVWSGDVVFVRFISHMVFYTTSISSDIAAIGLILLFVIIAVFLERMSFNFKCLLMRISLLTLTRLLGFYFAFICFWISLVIFSKLRKYLALLIDAFDLFRWSI